MTDLVLFVTEPLLVNADPLNQLTRHHAILTTVGFIKHLEVKPGNVKTHANSWL